MIMISSVIGSMIMIIIIVIISISISIVITSNIKCYYKTCYCYH